MIVAATGGSAAVASWLIYGDRAGVAMTAATAAALLLASSKPKGSDVGFVYLLHAPKYEAFKIGWSRSPIDRAERIRAEAGEKIRLVTYGPGPMTYEQSLHDRYAAHRVFTPLPAASEWFALSPDEAAEVAAELKARR
jgi:hypothetical protein